MSASMSLMSLPVHVRAPHAALSSKRNISLKLVPQPRQRFHLQSRTVVRAGAEVSYSTAPALLKEACQTKKVDPTVLFDALQCLENSKEKRVSLEDINGEWELCFTTGTKKTPTGGGTGSYFPIRAVQSFNAEDLKIRNGVILGPIQFFFDGEFLWRKKQRMLEFTFLKVSLALGSLGPLSMGTGDPESWNSLKALEQGVVNGEGNIEKATPGKIGANPFFTFVHVDEDVCVARGRGGGIAFWSKISDQPKTE